MNLQQLEYIVAVDTHRHFVKAAEQCFVTQATLSMMIKKLEEELNVTLFNRGKYPIEPTEIGVQLIAQARRVLHEAALMKQLVADTQELVQGDLHIGVIPTLAPYLLPLFLKTLLESYPLLHVKVNELSTEQIITALNKGQIDVGILATPLQIESLREHPLFYERFLVFVSDEETVLTKHFVTPDDLDFSRLWLLEEGHCMRSQMLNICALRAQQTNPSRLAYEAGSIESLLKIVEINKGLTIVPELAVYDFSTQQRNQVREFIEPVPVREISLVTHQYFLKTKILNALKQTIIEGVTPRLHSNINTHTTIVGIQEH